MNEELLALAARCEAASGPDRELDAAICVALGIEPQAREMLQFPAYDGCVRYFTASLDAAMTLVPEGWDWGIAWFGPRGSEAQAWPRGDHTSERKAIGSSDGDVAVALCAAALRARATQGGSDHV